MVCKPRIKPNPVCCVIGRNKNAAGHSTGKNAAIAYGKTSYDTIGDPCIRTRPALSVILRIGKHLLVQYPPKSYHLL